MRYNADRAVTDYPKAVAANQLARQKPGDCADERQWHVRLKSARDVPG
jgi:hypothetical protein